MRTEKEILEAIKNHIARCKTLNIRPSFSFVPKTNDNPENGFSKREDCVSHITKEKLSWGSNLKGWVEEKNNRFYPCFNIYD